MTPDLPGHERRQQRRLERTLNDDLPGAPPGFLLDPDDHHGDGDQCCAREHHRPNELVDADHELGEN